MGRILLGLCFTFASISAFPWRSSWDANFRVVAKPATWRSPGSLSGLVRFPDGMRRPVSKRDAIRSQFLDVLEAQRKGDRQCRRLAPCGPRGAGFSKGSLRLGWISEIVTVLIVF